MGDRITYVGLDAHKDGSSSRSLMAGCAARLGIANTAAALERLIRKLGSAGVKLRFCYEAGPCAYANST